MDTSTYGSLDFMKIRHYIIDRITGNGGEPVAFPSTRKLAEMFEVSQPTALRAVRDLVKDGYLMPLKTGGSISLRQDIVGGEHSRIFGALVASGDLTFMHHYYLKLYAELGLELTERSLCYQLQNLLLESPSLLESAVKNANMSGLLMMAPRADFAKPALSLRSQGIAVASLMADFPGISSLDVNYRELVTKLLKRLFREGRTRVILHKFPQPTSNEEVEAGIADACRAAGVPTGRVILLAEAGRKNNDRFRELLEFGTAPDAVIFLMMNLEIFEMLRERAGEHDCRLICDEDSLRRDIPFTGDVVCFDLAGASRRLVDNLLEQLEGEAPVLKGTVEYELKTCTDGKLN